MGQKLPKNIEKDKNKLSLSGVAISNKDGLTKYQVS